MDKESYKRHQWNINGYHNKLHKLQIIMKSNEPAVMCLQEIHLKDDHIVNLSNNKSYHKKSYL